MNYNKVQKAVNFQEVLMQQKQLTRFSPSPSCVNGRSVCRTEPMAARTRLGSEGSSCTMSSGSKLRLTFNKVAAAAAARTVSSDSPPLC
jgi:hypothetical protein